MTEVGEALFKRLMSSESPLPLSKLQEEMGTHFNTLKHHLKYVQMAQRMPRVKVRKVGKQVTVETEKTDEDLEFLKEIIGEELPSHVYLLVELLEAEATAIERAVPVSIFPKEQRILDELAAQQRIIITTNGRLYLTPLGIGIASGAKRYISLTGAKRRIQPSARFDFPASVVAIQPTLMLGEVIPGIKIVEPKVETVLRDGILIVKIHFKGLKMATEEEVQM